MLVAIYSVKTFQPKMIIYKGEILFIIIAPRDDKVKVKFGKKKDQGYLLQKRTKEISCKKKCGGDFFVFGGVGGVPPPQ